MSFVLRKRPIISRGGLAAVRSGAPGCNHPTGRLGSFPAPADPAPADARVGAVIAATCVQKGESMKSTAQSISAALLALALPLPAMATLGEDAASTQADQLQMKAAIRVAQSGTVTVHEIQAPSGTVIREFVSPAGKVFAVLWQGPSLPDLRQVLGSYFDPYVEAAQSKRTGRGPVSVQQSGLVVESTGRMRAFSGRAYVPQLLPPGITVDDIR